MRFIVLTVLLSSVSALNSTIDEMTALWVLGAINGSSESFPSKPNVVSPNPSTPPPNVNTPTPKLNLNPTPIKDSSVDCKTKDDENGICVSYYQCDVKSKTVITDGSGLLDLRINTCPHYLEVCCKSGDTLNITRQAESDDGETMANAPNRNKNPESFPVWITPPSTPAPPQKCGRSNPSIRPFDFINKDLEKKVGFALFGDFPWMVALLKKSHSTVWSKEDYLGGGTLIHPSVVMTVAHKLSTQFKNYTEADLKCRAGEWDTQTDMERYQHQERNVRKFIVHEDYYRPSLYNDIVLFVLEKPFQLDNAPHIRTACLASSLPTPGSVCYSMGWGRTDPKDKKIFADVLKKVLLHPVEHKTCERMLQATPRMGPYFQLHESLTCAVGDENVDTCKGDGGAPLVCSVSNDQQFAVYGMVVYGITCFNTTVPGVYADTVHLKSWIDAKMIEEGFGTSTYTL